jgi:hypothetical protein
MRRRHPWWPAATICVCVLSLAAVGLILANPDTTDTVYSEAFGVQSVTCNQLMAFICFAGVITLIVLVKIDRDERAESMVTDRKRHASAQWVRTHKISRYRRRP